MRAILIAAISAAALATLPTLASADDAMTGAAGGAVAGAVVGGPVGAVIGGAIGGTVGAASDADRRDHDHVIVKEEPAQVHKRTCVDDGVEKTCTDVVR